MRPSVLFATGALFVAACVCIQGQNPQGKEAPPDTKGLPPRAAPSDYQSQTQAGALTLAAEFKGHSVPTFDNVLSSEDYVVVEAALFGDAGSRTKLATGDFSLRINGKKAALPAQPYGLVLSSLKDPAWDPPESKSKSKTSLGSGGQGESSGPPAPVKIPIEVQRAMAQHVQQSVLPEGDRSLPQAGLLFFQYRGKAQGIRSVELIYSGPAGNAVLPLQP